MTEEQLIRLIDKAGNDEIHIKLIQKSTIELDFDSVVVIIKLSLT